MVRFLLIDGENQVGVWIRHVHRAELLLEFSDRPGMKKNTWKSMGNPNSSVASLFQGGLGYRCEEITPHCAQKKTSNKKTNSAQFNRCHSGEVRHERFGRADEHLFRVDVRSGRRDLFARHSIAGRSPR